VLAVLRKTGGCKRHAADALQIGRRTLDLWLERWAMEARFRRPPGPAPASDHPEAVRARLKRQRARVA
jgi:hypothetical protein